MTKIVADACSNHLGDRRLIEEMIRQAAICGVDIVKFQSFNADKLNPSWPDYDRAKLYYKSVQLSDDDHVFILEKCKQYYINPMFTAFDVERAEFLLNIGVELVKIASPDANNDELVDFCALNFGQQSVFVSYGMTNKVPDGFTKSMYCVSRYPCPYNEIDFDKMKYYDGFSDHTEGIQAAKKAIDMGMKYIERHFTLGKYLPGKDHFFSSTPDEFKELCDYRDYKNKIQLYKTRWR